MVYSGVLLVGVLACSAVCMAGVDFDSGADVPEEESVFWDLVPQAVDDSVIASIIINDSNFLFVFIIISFHLCLF